MKFYLSVVNVRHVDGVEFRDAELLGSEMLYFGGDTGGYFLCASPIDMDLVGTVDTQLIGESSSADASTSAEKGQLMALAAKVGAVVPDVVSERKTIDEIGRKLSPFFNITDFD